VGNTFGEGFFWTEVIDAAADVYNGVCELAVLKASSIANYGLQFVFWTIVTGLPVLVWCE
jgi:hypothetical protein